jgi:hypothetical protein
MRKRDELTDPSSCLFRAWADEALRLRESLSDLLPVLRAALARVPHCHVWDGKNYQQHCTACDLDRAIDQTEEDLDEDLAEQED